MGAVVLAAASRLWRQAPSAPTDRPLMTLGIDSGGDATIAGAGWAGLNWVGPAAVLSPDGRSLVFIARGPSGGRWQLFMRRLDELKAAPITGTEGAYAPFFSPDGSSVGFFASGRLMKVALSGGTVTPICPVEEARGGAWSEDGSIVFAPRPDGPLYRVAASGGEPSQATTLEAASGEVTHRWPQFLPGGKSFVFTAHGNTGAAREGNVVVQSADGRKLVHRGGIFGRYAPSGHLLYVNGGKLFAEPFDLERLEATGRAVAVADDVATAPISGTAQYSFSSTGVLVYRRARNAKRLLQWMDPSGQVQPMRSVPAEYREARFSRDANRLLLTIDDGGQEDIWSYDVARDALTRLTFYADNDRAGMWSPDATHIVYSSWQADVGTFNLFMQRAAGGGEPQRLTTSKNLQSATRLASERQVHPDVGRASGQRLRHHALADRDGAQRPDESRHPGGADRNARERRRGDSSHRTDSGSRTRPTSRVGTKCTFDRFRAAAADGRSRPMAPNGSRGGRADCSTDSPKKS